jgi:hypothetical protein
MAGRRGWGEDSVYFDHSGECLDADKHRHCPGRWRGVVSLGFGPEGRRLRKKVSGTSKSQVRARLTELHDDLNDGVVTQADYTVQKAINEWLDDGLPGRSAKTVSTYREVLAPLSEIIGNIPLHALTAAHVRSALTKLGATRSTRTLAIQENTPAARSAVRPSAGRRACRAAAPTAVSPPAPHPSARTGHGRSG